MSDFILLQQLSRDVASLLMEEITFQLLLTSDLDGGVSMATRTQAKHMLIGIAIYSNNYVFHFILFRYDLQ